MTGARSRHAGVLSILQYNWHFYAASLAALVGMGALLRSGLLPSITSVVLVGAITLTLFWTLSSLLVSYYVYDYRKVTRWEWIHRVLASPPRRWLNIHAGLDESSEILAHLFPDAGYVVVDIYDDREMTEPSIARARELHPSPVPSLRGRLDALPLPDGDRDTMFLLFAAHEIRHPARRTELFRECARVMDNAGQLILVEHLRDWRNFVAFGPGFLHFHSRTEWLRATHDAGLMVTREERVTPFVRCFLMTKVQA
jgi:ubiquinone/menaquinone biosynthesis C-methylase UbiE